MTGSLQQKNGTYFAVVRVKDHSGKVKQKWINTGVKATGGKRKAQAKLREIVADLEKNHTVFSAELSFIDWMDKWMAQKKNDVRMNTYEAYEQDYEKHIKPFFNPLRLTLTTISGQHIQEYYNAKIKERISPTTIRKHNVLIRGALQDAIKKGYILYNPANQATLPRKEKYIGQAYTIKQAEALLEVAEDDPMKPAIILGLFYGLRRSEVCGLRWKDISFEKNTIRICNTVVVSKTLIEHEKTKSKASNRTMFIIPETRDYFLALKQSHKETVTACGKEFTLDLHVCSWPDGSGFKPNYISQHFAALLKKFNLPHIRFHELRHTAGSILLEKGLSIKQIQEYLGHENVSTTLDIYGHLSLEGKKEAANVMGSLISI